MSKSVGHPFRARCAIGRTARNANAYDVARHLPPPRLRRRDHRPLTRVRALAVADGQPAVPPGTYAIADEELWTDAVGRPLVNRSDCVGLREHPDPRRHAGCCGRDGCQGPNLRCANGHDVATERSDCWMPHGVVLWTADPADA